MTTPAMPATRQPLWLFGALFLLGSIWGSTFTIAKLTGQYGIPGMAAAFWSAAIGSAFLLALNFARGKVPPLGRADLRYYFATGTLGIAIPSSAIYTAAIHLPAGVLAMVVTTAPMLTYALALGLRMERFDPRRLAGLLLGLLAIAALLLPSGGLRTSDYEPGWLLLALVAPTMYAINSIVGSRYRPHDADSRLLACGMLACAAALMLPAGFLADAVYLPMPPFHGGDLAIFGLGLLNGFAHVLFFLILGRAGPVFFSQVGYIVTAMGVIWGMLLFGERHGLLVWGALALLVGGVALVSPRRER